MLACCCAGEKKEDVKSIVGGARSSLDSSLKAHEEEPVPINAIGETGPEELAAEAAKSPSSLEVQRAPTAREFFEVSFDVELTLRRGETLGLELDPLDEKTMEICAINDGIVKKYNDAVRDRTRALQPGDFIVAINGVQGSTNAMIQRVKDDGALKVSVRRLKAWEVNLTQDPSFIGSMRPCLSRAENGRTLLIVDIDDKVFKQWNEAHPDLDIQKHDRISKINGIAFDASKMIIRVDKDVDLSLQVVRPSLT